MSELPQVFHPYTKWEDWQAGMWQCPANVTAEMERAARILTDADLFRTAARAMLHAWPAAAEHNLTDMVHNQRAWIGQATCCHAVQVSEQSTRLAWWTLTATQQYQANQVADQVIAEWRSRRLDEHTPGLFDLNPALPTTVERSHIHA